ncbi:MAG: hypothetical protein ACHQRM_13810 [Bacteroidia bacterium]
MKNTHLQTQSCLNTIKTALVILALTCGFQHSFAQLGNGVVFQPMHILGESITHMDVSGSIVRCDSTNTIHLKVFNENNSVQTASFQIIVRNTATGDNFTASVNIPNLPALGTLEADCSGNASLAPLVINLPASYDPAKTIMHISF